MKNLIIKISYLSLLLLIIVVFKNWFSFGIISSGDWHFRFENQIRNFTIFPYLWTHLLNNTGGNINFLLGLHTYFLATTAILFRYFNFSWLVIERLMWFWPFILISFFSSLHLFKLIFPKNNFSFLSPFIFIFNTYILMIVGGGQMGVAIAYSIAPLVLALFLKLIEDKQFSLKKSTLTGLAVALQLIFDSRIFYMTIFSVFIYFVLSEFRNGSIRKLIEKFVIIFFVPGILAFLINAFWIIPLLINPQSLLSQLETNYSTQTIAYFSFAKFEETISLLHPYWPENIFGKIGFMKPEFLVIPIIAYTSLLFGNLRGKKHIVFFSLLGLIGGFLAKGTNDPFGGVYLFAFDYIPGFVLFRDPTKWYLLIVISYCVLIPFSIQQIYEWLKSKNQFYHSKIFNLQNIFLLLTFSYLLFIIKPAWSGELTGTFKEYIMPQDYIKLENFLSRDGYFYRTFWVPVYERFGFRSDIHPSISGRDFVNKYNKYDVVKYLNNKDSLITLQNLGVKYLIVPLDLQNEIFLKDRKYDNTEYLKTTQSLGEVPWLKKVDDFGKIKVFELPNPKGHFFIKSDNPVSLSEVRYKTINPTKYEINVSNARKGDVLVFSESYDKYWVANYSSITINSSEFDGRINRFVLPKDGNYKLEVYYKPQKLVDFVLPVSMLSLLSAVIYLIFGYKPKK